LDLIRLANGQIMTLTLPGISVNISQSIEMHHFSRFGATTLLLANTAFLPAKSQSFGEVEDYFIGTYCDLVEKGYSREKLAIELNSALMQDLRFQQYDTPEFRSRLATGIALFCPP
jgi:hypothetical protein